MSQALVTVSIINEKLNRTRSGWIIQRQGPRLSMSKMIQKKFVTFTIQYVGVGTSGELKGCGPVLELKPVTYQYQSKNSHFDYVEQEHRWMRNKVAFYAIINALKAADVWKYIDNRHSFLQLNKNCKTKSNRHGLLTTLLK